MSRIFPGQVVLYLLLLLTLDITILPAFFPQAFRPILLYLWIPFVAVRWHWRLAVPMAFLVGLFRDFASVQPLGVETVVLVSYAILLSLFTQKMERESLLMQLLVTFLFIFMSLCTILVLSGFLISGHPIGGYGFFISMASALSSTFAAPFFFSLSDKWFHGRSILKQYELFG